MLSLAHKLYDFFVCQALYIHDDGKYLSLADSITFACSASWPTLPTFYCGFYKILPTVSLNSSATQGTRSSFLCILNL
jgi:hypothetical protein